MLLIPNHDLERRRRMELLIDRIENSSREIGPDHRNQKLCRFFVAQILHSLEVIFNLLSQLSNFSRIEIADYYYDRFILLSSYFTFSSKKSQKHGYSKNTKLRKS